MVIKYVYCIYMYVCVCGFFFSSVRIYVLQSITSILYKVLLLETWVIQWLMSRTKNSGGGTGLSFSV